MPNAPSVGVSECFDETAMHRLRLACSRVLGRACLLALTLVPVPSLAQQSAPSTPLVLDSVSAEVARHQQVLATDSMWAQTTPSPELERTAQYVAAQFEALGLLPKVSAKGDLVLSRFMRSREQYGWIQRYRVPGQRGIDYATSAVHLFLNRIVDARGFAILSEEGNTMMRINAISLAAGARLASSGLGSLSTFGDGGSDAAIVAGRQTIASLRNAAVHNRPVFYVPFPGEDAAAHQGIIDYLVTVSEGVIVLDDADSVSFAAALQAARQQPRPFLESYLKEAPGTPGWVVHMRREMVTPWLALAGIDMARVYADTAPVVQTVRGQSVGLTLQADSTPQEVVTAPNVIGLLEGTDPVLKHEYVVISAPLEARGARATSSDRAGLPALLAIARALSQPGARPRRSLLFVATSGTTQGGWGSAFLAGQLPRGQSQAKVVANIHLDTRERPGGDTLTVDGAGDLQLPVPLTWVAAQHPELEVVVKAGATVLQPQPQLEVFVFVRRMIPTLVFDLPPEREVSGGRAADIETTPLTRATGLAFHISHALATADARPWWTTEARQRYLRLFPAAP